MKVLLVAFIAFVLVGCTTKTIEVKKTNPFTGTFPTADIRMMWQSCIQGHAVARRFPPNVAGLICDCVSDETRKDFDVNDIKSIYADNATREESAGRQDMLKYWTNKNLECEMKTMQPHIQPEPQKIEPAKSI